MDASQIFYAVILLTFLGLLLSFNPMLIVVDFLLVLKTKRPIFNTIVLLAGFATSIIILFAIASMFIDPDTEVSLKQIGSSLDIPSSVELFAGFTLAIYGFKRYEFNPKPKKRRSLVDFDIPQKTKQIYFFGVAKSLLSVTNIFAVLILASQAVKADWSIGISSLALIWFLLIGVLPLIYIMYLHWFKKESLLKIDQKLNSLLNRDTTNWFSVGLMLVGAGFILKALTGLFGN